MADNIKKELYKAKAEAYKRLYFRLANPSFPLPTSAQFEALKVGDTQIEETVDPEQINSVLDALNRPDSTPEVTP